MIPLYLDQPSWAHRLPPALKLTAVAALAVALTLAQDPAVAAGALLAVTAVYVTLGRAALAQLRALRPLLPMLLAVLAFHLWLGSWREGGAIVLQVLAMVLLAHAVTMTTTMAEMLDVLEPPLRPLRHVGLPGERVALAVALVIRFVPVFFALWASMAEAWRARTGRSPGLRLLPAFLLQALGTAGQVAEALDARAAAAPARPGRLPSIPAGRS